VTVREFAVDAVRPAGDRAAGDRAAGDRAAGDRAGDLLDVDVRVTCSSGTYIRALARDLGAALGVGGHLTALRRTRVGPYLASQARTLEELAAGAEQAGELAVIPLAVAAAAAFPRRELTDAQALALAHGARLDASGTGDAPVAAFAPDGSLVALLTDEEGRARSLAVFATELAAGPVGGS
jgi:tRNA pseudouridine55 synthase